MNALPLLTTNEHFFYVGALGYHNNPALRRFAEHYFPVSGIPITDNYCKVREDSERAGLRFTGQGLARASYVSIGQGTSLPIPYIQEQERLLLILPDKSIRAPLEEFPWITTTLIKEIIRGRVSETADIYLEEETKLRQKQAFIGTIIKESRILER